MRGLPMSASDQPRPAIAIRAGRIGDEGTCAARLPRLLGFPAGTPLLVESAAALYLCVSVPLEASPSRKRDLRSQGDAGRASAATPRPARIDRTLCFVAEGSRGPLREHQARPAVCHRIDASPGSAAAGASQGPGNAIYGGGMASSGFLPAEEIFVEPIFSQTNGRDMAWVLARAKKALRCVGCVPDGSHVASGYAHCLSLLDSGSGRIVAQISMRPQGAVAVLPETKFSLCGKLQPLPLALDSLPERCSSERDPVISKNSSHAYRAVCELLQQDIPSFWEMDASPVTGLLLSGPPGIGKTMGVRSAAVDNGFRVVSIEIGSNSSHGAPARAMRSAFDKASALAKRGMRCVVFLDELDALCPKRAGGGPGVHDGTAEESRTVAQLLTLMDGGGKRQYKNPREVVYVIAATNRPNAIDPALRRPGRFDREITLLAPNAEERQNVLHSVDTRLDVACVKRLGRATAGYVASDLVQLRDEAEKLLVAQALPGGEADDERSRKPFSISQCYERALGLVSPSLLRGSLGGEVPPTSWNDVGGMEHVKQRLRMAVEWPLDHNDTFQRLGLQGPRGVLLHGPPGCSKTTLVRAMAASGMANFLHMSGADVYSCFLGEAERLLREAFATARAAAPCVLFLDELDALVGKREVSSGTEQGNQVQSRVLSTLLTEMDGMNSGKGVLVVGATNRLDLLDDALLRPGRFDEVLLVDKLSDRGRQEVLEIHSRALPLDQDVDLEQISNSMPFASGAQVRAVCQEAAMHALRSCAALHSEPTTSACVARRDFEAAIALVIRGPTK